MRRRGRGGRGRRHRTFNVSAGGGSGQGLLAVSNHSISELFDWLDRRHRAPCTDTTPVWFAPFSPNGIGNKIMAMVMAFHMAITERRVLVVTDWPPSTLKVSYTLGDVLRPSSCQALFDGDATRPAVQRCSIVACPLRTRSRFRNGYTQMHWAHQSANFLEVPRAWADRLDWLTWWRALTQYLFEPGQKLLDGLAATLARTTLLRSTPTPLPAKHPELVIANTAARGSSGERGGFARRFAEGVARWGGVRRPLIGLHVRMGDGCDDDKRGGCKYVTSWASAVTRLRQAGLTSGTIFLATDRAAIAREALREGAAGFVVLTLAQDRDAVERSHLKGLRRAEGNELLHWQLLDLALLSQAEVVDSRGSPGDQTSPDEA